MLRIYYGQVRILFTGDLNFRSHALLLKHIPAAEFGCHVAKACHHGSEDISATFLEAMLTSRDENGEPFSDYAIFGNAMTMLVAGEDTTAYTLAWCAHHLLESPNDLERLRSELTGVLGDDSVPRSMEDVRRGARGVTHPVRTNSPR